jgi:tetratricopeptide (TPR) repeat protein
MKPVFFSSSLLCILLLCVFASAAREAAADVWFQYTHSNGDTSFSVTFSSGGWQWYGYGMGDAVVYPLGYGPGHYYPAHAGPPYPAPPSSMPYYLRRVYSGPGLLPFSWDRYGTLVDGPVKPIPSQEKYTLFRYNRAVARGREILKTGDYRTATEFFRAAVLEDASKPEAKFLLALALIGTGQFSLASKSLRRAMADSNAQEWLQTDIRAAYADEGAFETHLRSAEAWRNMTDNAASGLLLACLLAGSGRQTDAVGALDRALKLAPGDPELLKLRAALQPQAR